MTFRAAGDITEIDRSGLSFVYHAHNILLFVLPLCIHEYTESSYDTARE